MRSLIVFILSIHFFTISALSQDREFDLSTGVASPSNTDSIAIDPAVLGILKTRQFDVFTRLGPIDTTFGGAYSHGGEKVGFGFQLYHRSGSSTGVLGVGYDFGSIQLGGNVFLDLEDFEKTFNLALRFETGKNLAIALVFYNIANFEYRLTLGFAFMTSKTFTPEFDLTFDYDTFQSKFLEVSGTFGLRLSVEKLTLKAGTAFQIQPELQFLERSLELGGAYWVGSDLAFYGILNAPFLSIYPSSETQLGLKIRL